MSRLPSMARGQFRRHGSKNTTKPPLTHCKYYFSEAFSLADLPEVLSFPIGHHESLRESISAFTSGLLVTRPIVPGLDRTIVIPPRRLHLTLGVMSLEDANDSNHQAANNPRKTLSEALALLTSLQPQISELLRGARLKVPLQMMDIMPPDGGNPDEAHVLWLGPSLENEDAQRLLQVGEMVNRAFTAAGFISDHRPLKLHCTVLNTTYRRPKTRGRRVPFSYRSLLGSIAAQAFLLEPLGKGDWDQPVKVDFGTWHVDEIQICKMGSYGPEGEYQSCGGLVLSLPPPQV